MVVAPGTYSVTLEVGGQSQTQQLRILKDPNSEGTLGDIRAQLAMFAEVREDYEEVDEEMMDMPHDSDAKVKVMKLDGGNVQDMMNKLLGGH